MNPELEGLTNLVNDSATFGSMEPAPAGMARETFFLQLQINPAIATGESVAVEIHGALLHLGEQMAAWALLQLSGLPAKAGGPASDESEASEAGDRSCEDCCACCPPCFPGCNPSG